MPQRPGTAIVAALLAAAPLTAQAPPAPADSVAPRWDLRFGLALNSSGGNERLTVGTAELGLTRLQTEAFELAFHARARYGRSQGADVARNGQASINLDLVPRERWSPFLFTLAERDRFKKLDLRASGGFGAKRTFWSQGDWEDLSLSGAVLFSFEDLAPADTAATGATKRQFRWSVRFRVRRRIGQTLELEQVTFFQPRFDMLDDYLANARTAARFGLSEHLAFAVNFLYEYDSTPPVDVHAEDWELTVGVEMKTRW